jgi:ribosomal-protein-alanine N-acetyltransferase
MAGEPLDYPSPELRDHVVLLRPWSMDDLACVRAAGRDPQLREGTSVPEEDSDTASEAFIVRQWGRAESGQGRSMVIVELARSQAVGQVWLGSGARGGVVDLGYWLIPSARGRGLASRAVALATQWALTTGGAARVEAWVVPENAASHRLLERAGFTREGVLRSFLEFETRRSDAVVYSRLPHDP